MATSSTLCSSSRDTKDTLDILYESFRVVKHSDEEVGCKRSGQDSLEALLARFPSSQCITSTQNSFSTLTSFSEKLFGEIKSIFVVSGQPKLSVFQEQSLRKFHKLRMDTLPLIWKSLAEELQLPPVNAFQQQAVNRNLFENFLIDAAKPLTPIASETTPKPRTQLTIEEDNAVQYAGGYVAMKLLKSIKSYHPSMLWSMWRVSLTWHALDKSHRFMNMLWNGLQVLIEGGCFT